MSQANGTAERFRMHTEPQAERAVLGSLLLGEVNGDYAAADAVLATLSPADFINPDLRKIFSAMVRLRADGKPSADTTLLASELREQVEHAPGVLLELVNEVATTAHAEHYAALVREASRQRRLVCVVNNALLAARDATHPEALNNVIDDLADRVTELRAERPRSTGVTYQRISSAELATSSYGIEFLIDGAMVKGQPLTIGGPMKSLKTSILIDAAVSLASGGHFLGRLPVTSPQRVLVMSGESGLATIQETALRIGRAAGIELASLGNLTWSPDLPRFGNIDHLDALGRMLDDDGIEVLFCDPAYLAMPSTDANNLMAQGELLRNMAEVCQSRGVTPVLCHHTKRNIGQDAYEPLELQHLAWAGHAEFARQWWLVNRRERYEPGTGEHRLWLSVGGSAGHSSLWAADIHEGTLADLGGRRWWVELSDAAGARDAAKERQQTARQERAGQQLEADRKAICEALATFGDAGETKSVVRAAAGLNTGRFDPALASLLRDKIVAPTKIVKGKNQTYDAFKLTDN